MVIYDMHIYQQTCICEHFFGKLCAFPMGYVTQIYVYDYLIKHVL